jgi:hypothetical protein
MKLKITYEWCVEHYINDADGDITDSNFSDALTFDESVFDAPDGQKARLCLVRKAGNDAEGETDRWCAYVQDGKLPQYFDTLFSDTGGVPIPQKYHKQIATYPYKNI